LRVHVNDKGFARFGRPGALRYRFGANFRTLRGILIRPDVQHLIEWTELRMPEPA